MNLNAVYLSRAQPSGLSEQVVDFPSLVDIDSAPLLGLGLFEYTSLVARYKKRPLDVEVFFCRQANVFAPLSLHWREEFGGSVFTGTAALLFGGGRGSRFPIQQRRWILLKKRIDI